MSSALTASLKLEYLDCPLESDVTDYEDENDYDVEVLSDDDTAGVGTKRAFKEEVEEESIEVVEVLPQPVQYNPGKYFKKKKLYERCEITEMEPRPASTLAALPSNRNPSFVGRYFESREEIETRTTSAEPTVELTEILDVKDFIKLETADRTVKQELETGSRINIGTVKTEDVLTLHDTTEEDGGERNSFLASNKLEVIIKEEYVEADSGDLSDHDTEGPPAVSTEAQQIDLDSRVGDSNSTNGSAGIKVEKKEEAAADIWSAREEKRLQRLNLLRPWTKTGLGRELEAGSRQPPPRSLGFRVLSYNILAPSIVGCQPHLFSRRPADVMDWSRRLRRIQREVDVLQPDIVCLQEVLFAGPTSVQADVADYFSQRGYSYRGRRRAVVDGGGGRADGCAIFFRSALFALDTWKAVEAADELAGKKCARAVGLICRLRPADARSTSTTMRLVVATLHNRFGQNHFVSRLADTAVLLADLDELAYEDSTSYYPTVLTGDFNVEPYTDIHRLITKGVLYYEGLKCGPSKYPRRLLRPQLCLADSLQWERNLVNRGQHHLASYRGGRCWHGFNFRSAYQFRAERELYKGCAPPESEVSAYQGTWINVDYIFYSTVPALFPCADGKMESKLKLLGRWTLPTGSQLARLGGLPSSVSPSDHLPLAADFLLLLT